MQPPNKRNDTKDNPNDQFQKPNNWVGIYIFQFQFENLKFPIQSLNGIFITIEHSFHFSFFFVFSPPTINDPGFFFFIPYF